MIRFIQLHNPIKLVKYLFLAIPSFLCFYYSFSSYSKGLPPTAIFEDMGLTVVFLQIMTYPFCAYVCNFIEKNNTLRQNENLCKLSLLILLFSQIITKNVLFIFLLLFTAYHMYHKDIFILSFKKRESINFHVAACLAVIVLTSLLVLWVRALI